VDGDVFDVSPSRLLYSRFDGVLVARERAGGAEVELGPVLSTPSNFLFTPFAARLTSAGAVWVTPQLGSQTCADPQEAWEWRNGSTHRIWQACGGEPTALVGDFFAAGVAVSGGIAAGVLVHNAATGDEHTATWPAPVGSWRLAPDGAVFGVEAGGQRRVFRFQAGAMTTLAAPPPGAVVGADGVNVAFSGADVTVLSPATSHTTKLTGLLQPSAGGTPLVMRGGWSAFNANSSSGTSQVWTAAPDGTLLQVTGFGTPSRFEAIDGAGNWTAVKGNTFDASARRILGTLAVSNVVSTTLGTAVPRCDGWYVLMGNTAFSIPGAPVPPGECAPASTPDAGTDNDGGDGGQLGDGGAGDGGAVADASPGTDGSGGDDAGGGVSHDAGAGGDGGGGSNDGGGGCSMSAAPSTPVVTPWLALGALALVRRRRRTA